MQDLSFVPNANPFCVLLAGGQGSRLHELTREICKPAVPFTGGRLVDFTIANAVSSGLAQMLVATQYQPEALTSHIDRAWRSRFARGVQIRDGKAREPSGYSGTADALRANLPEILASGAREILVLSADHVYRMDYQPMIARHREGGAKVTVAVDEVALAAARDFGVLSAGTDGRVTAFHEKPRHPQPSPGDDGRALVSLGIYVFDTDWLTDLLAEEGMDDFGQHVLPAAVEAGVAQVHCAAQAAEGRFYWRDVGTLASYRTTWLDFVDPEDAPFVTPAGTPGLSREALRAALQHSVLLPGAQLSARARVSNAILGPGTVIPDGMVIGEDPEEDHRWFRVAGDGTVLVTEAMVQRHQQERARPVTIGCSLAPVLAGFGLTISGRGN